MLFYSCSLMSEIVSSGLKNFLDSCFLREAEDEEACMVRNDNYLGHLWEVQTSFNAC